jgi:hypothetical protein
MRCGTSPDPTTTSYVSPWTGHRCGGSRSCCRTTWTPCGTRWRPRTSTRRRPMMVTIFDRTIGDQLARFLPRCDVTSPADLAAPSLAGPCIQPGLLAVTRAGDLPRGIRTAGAVLDEVPVTVRARRRASATVRPPASARCASRRDPLTGSRSRCREGRRLATPVPDLSLDAPNATQPACSRDLEMPTTPRPSGQSVECQIHCKNCQLS